MRWKQAKWYYDEEVVREAKWCFDDEVVCERLRQGKRDVAELKGIKSEMYAIPKLRSIVQVLSNEEIFILFWILIIGEVPALCSLMRNNNERRRILANIWRHMGMETTLSHLRKRKEESVMKKKHDKALKEIKKRTSAHLMPFHGDDFNRVMHSAAKVQPMVKTERM